MMKQRKNIHTINNIKNESEIYWFSLNKDQVDILTINIKFEEKSLYPLYEKQIVRMTVLSYWKDITLSR